jgi:myosin heavy subunit
MGQHDQDSQGSVKRRILAVCGAAVLAVTGGSLGGYVASALADPDGKGVATEAADASEALQQEREKSQQLERQLVGALKHIAALGDLVGQVAHQNQELADLRQALDEERAPSQASPTDSPELQQEQAKAEGLARNLAAARQEIEAQSAAIARAAEQAREAQKTAERMEAELRGQIAEAGTRVEGLSHDLATARQDNESLATALKAATVKAADTSRLEELQQALRQSEAQRQSLAQALQMQAAAAAPKPQLAAVETVAVRRAPIAVASAAPATAPPAPATAETLRLLARAHQLVEQRNISGARQILESVTETGHPPALFALAETYDPNVLAAWGTVGTQGDIGRARELYGKARAGGVAEAEARLKALP